MQFMNAHKAGLIRITSNRIFIAFLMLVASINAHSDAVGPGLIVTDLPVTHSLVSMVMGDIGNPKLLMQGSASPHDYALRPSEVKSLQTANLLVWTSENLTPWLSRALNNSRQSINHIELMDAPDTVRLTFREDQAFSDDHGHVHEDSNDPHNKSEAMSIDPHGWLDPVNGIYWLQVIANKLAILDPTNVHRYRDNALAAQEQLRTLQQNINLQLASVSGRPFIVFHDSYHYFEERFNIHAKAAIALGDAELPGIRRMNTLRQQLMAFDDACVFTEPQFNDRLVASLTRGLSIATGSLDPLGTTFQTGPELYPTILRQIANELHDCLKDQNTK